MKVLIADKLSPTAIARLEGLGLNVVNQADLKAEDLPANIGDAEILIVRSTKVTAETIDAASNLALIVRAGAGVNTIDIQAASNHGVQVANCPGKNKDAVAELAIGMLVAADRQIVNACLGLREGKWEKKKYGKAPGLKGRTLGIIGLGSIGLSVARHAQSMEMDVVAWDNVLTPERAEALGVGYCFTALELAKKADAVSIHCAANAETHHLVNAEFLNAMKDGAILINTSRGQIVDTAALKTAIQEKGLNVALDVYENEPAAGDPAFNDPELANMITGTPHIGASTGQASEAIALEAARVVGTFVHTGKAANVLNLRQKGESGISMIVRHYNRVGVLANLLEKLKRDNINVEEMENTILVGNEAAICTLKVDHEPKPITLKKIMDNIHVMKIEIKKE
jgi:D-3-phosphoglycerate dehydrogenase